MLTPFDAAQRRLDREWLTELVTCEIGSLDGEEREVMRLRRDLAIRLEWMVASPQDLPEA